MMMLIAPEYLLFLGLLVSALILGHTPLRLPFRWAETYYHELSHGLACLLTFGRPRRIRLHFDGSGSCTTQGGLRVPILLAGYMGASVWGAILFLAGHKLGESGATLWLQLELALILVTIVLWVRDIKTLLILGIISAMYGLALLYGEQGYFPYLLQFTGMYVMMNAIRAPLALIDGRHVGDGAALADIFKVLPEGVWIVWWFIFGLATLYYCAAVTLPGFDLLMWWYG